MSVMCLYYNNNNKKKKIMLRNPELGRKTHMSCRSLPIYVIGVKLNALKTHMCMCFTKSGLLSCVFYCMYTGYWSEELFGRISSFKLLVEFNYSVCQSQMLYHGDANYGTNSQTCSQIITILDFSMGESINSLIAGNTLTL